MTEKATAHNPWEVFYATFHDLTSHLPQLTATGSRLPPDSPVQRALAEAERRALQTAWKVRGESYAKAFELAADLAATAQHWLRSDGVNRSALAAQLAERSAVAVPG
ncbi:MAG TPA: hypothetical protein VFE05_18015 [Longimicrobiaceae bacterium]|jgi:hypothetical protein|nr:hypothetical protein [Longimicrobiaceae bacterium]